MSEREIGTSLPSLTKENPSSIADEKSLAYDLYAASEIAESIRDFSTHFKRSNPEARAAYAVVRYANFCGYSDADILTKFFPAVGMYSPLLPDHDAIDVPYRVHEEVKEVTPAKKFLDKVGEIFRR